MKHCSDLTADRAIGQHWEREFGNMAADMGFMLTPTQIKHKGAALAFRKDGGKWNEFTLPDVVVWSHPGQHHEIKHKEPTRFDSFGLEAYRLYALLEFAKETQQDVMYTIHNHKLAGGRNAKANDIAHWVTANALRLLNTWSFEGEFPSWVDGTKQSVKQYFWSVNMWLPLQDYWEAL